MIVECGALHQQLTGSELRACRTFFLWEGWHDPRIFPAGPLRDGIDQMRSQGVGPDLKDRRTFLETINALGLWRDLE